MLRTYIGGAFCTLLAFAGAAEARVTKFTVEQKRVFANGQMFGSVGAYERLDGTATFEVDPMDPHNRGIINLSRAPKNTRGLIEFTSPFFLLKPVDLTKGNSKLFLTLNNRGNKISIARFNWTKDNNDVLNDPGDGFLLNEGFSILDIGWQGDVITNNNRMAPNLPIATQADGSPIVGPVRIEYSDRTIPAAGTYSLTLKGSDQFKSYPAATTDTSKARLTARAEVDGPRSPIPPDQWAFGECPTGKDSLKANDSAICLFEGFKANKLYELIYPAKNPIVMGLGYAITRDVGSFLRYSPKDDAGNPNPLARSATDVGIRRTYALGVSSTGMYMRDYLYLGFNEDEASRKVWDVVWTHIPGSHRLFANVEFADPDTYSREDDRQDFLSTTYGAMTYAVTKDPITGLTEGILKRPATDPLVIHSVTENEFWMFRASLDVADGEGRPVPSPDNVRFYLLSNFQHSGGMVDSFPSTSPLCRYPVNQNYAGPSLRAIFMALDSWADKGIAPPPSNYPRVEDGNLVTVDKAREFFPRIPGVQFPKDTNGLQVLDFGPEFTSEGGRILRPIPAKGRSYVILVPKTDSDGLNLAGIRPIEVRVPLGTNMGWNIRKDETRGPHLCGLSGSYIAFARTRTERLANGDPRPSLEERYKDHAGYVTAVKAAAAKMLAEGWLLPADADRFIKQAEISNVLR
jgi:hypothetical protein